MALEINIGEEYKIKIEKESEFKNSIFKEVYLYTSSKKCRRNCFTS
ncbi:hypothetical protein [Tenacibaculum finnmarkense]|nr:hypothetical protein [Tenacibaculum finnmarkense]